MPHPLQPSASPASPASAALPTETVAFLFTDLEGSTKLLAAHRAAYRDAVRRHHDLLREAVEATLSGYPSTRPRRCAGPPLRANSAAYPAAIASDPPRMCRKRKASMITATPLPLDDALRMRARGVLRSGGSRATGRGRRRGARGL